MATALVRSVPGYLLCPSHHCGPNVAPKKSNFFIFQHWYLSQCWKIKMATSNIRTLCALFTRFHAAWQAHRLPDVDTNAVAIACCAAASGWVSTL